MSQATSLVSQPAAAQRAPRPQPADLRFLAEDGREVAIADWRGAPVLLVFLRWLG